MRPGRPIWAAKCAHPRHLPAPCGPAIQVDRPLGMRHYRSDHEAQWGGRGSDISPRMASPRQPGAGTWKHVHATELGANCTLTPDGGSATSARKEECSVDLVQIHDPRYEELRSIHNGMIEKRPRVIAQCANPGDVIEALELARREDYEVAVRAGGHSVAGMCLNDEGLVIDVRPMKDIDVDPGGQRVRVGAGVTWGEFDRSTQIHGLATTGGRASTTGVAGLTLGGGSGWTERAFGLACDNLISVDLVTADGREVTASAESNPDLFWALHGGGGNFGVATSFEFRLHPLGPIVTAGLLMWPGAAAGDAARAYRDLAATAPDELGSGLVMISGPPADFVPAHLQGATVIAVAALWVGDVEEGAEAVRPLREDR